VASYRVCKNCGNHEAKSLIYECSRCRLYFCGKCGKAGWCPVKNCGHKGFQVGKIEE
jgi:hypothetical protein